MCGYVYTDKMDNSPLNAVDSHTVLGGYTSSHGPYKKKATSGAVRKKSKKQYKKRSTPYVKKSSSVKKKKSCSCSCNKSH